MFNRTHSPHSSLHSSVMYIFLIHVYLLLSVTELYKSCPLCVTVMESTITVTFSVLYYMTFIEFVISISPEH